MFIHLRFGGSRKTRVYELPSQIQCVIDVARTCFRRASSGGNLGIGENLDTHSIKPSEVVGLFKESKWKTLCSQSRCFLIFKNSSSGSLSQNFEPRWCFFSVAFHIFHIPCWTLEPRKWWGSSMIIPVVKSCKSCPVVGVGRHELSLDVYIKNMSQSKIIGHPKMILSQSYI
jgi:hypothetical protein